MPHGTSVVGQQEEEEKEEEEGARCRVQGQQKELKKGQCVCVFSKGSPGCHVYSTLPRDNLLHVLVPQKGGKKEVASRKGITKMAEPREKPKIIFTLKNKINLQDTF